MVEVHAFYAKQFEALRKVACSTDSFDFIKSVRAGLHCRFIKHLIIEPMEVRVMLHFCVPVIRSKKGVKRRYIFKVMKKNEFKMFLEMAPHYFTYMCKHYFHQLPSLLCKIVGIFKIVKTRYGAPGKA